jgi:methionyl-tRNA synthetase
MIHQYRGGAIPKGSEETAVAQHSRDSISAAVAAFENLEFSKGLEAIWSLLSVADKFIVERAPWVLAKKEDNASRDQLDATLYAAAEVARIATVLLAPVLPESAAKIWKQLGMTGSPEDTRLAELAWGQLEPGQKIGEVAAVFPRIDAKPAVARMRDLEVEEATRQAALLGKKPEAAEPASSQAAVSPIAPSIGIDDFAKVDLRVGRVVTAGPVKGADKLLHLHVDIGEAEPRSIVAGIALEYKPEDLVGRRVVIVANLEPRKLRGVLSQGMIVAASLEGGPPVLAGFLEEVPVGARLK